MQTGKVESLQSKLDACQSGNQDVILCETELDLCRDELIDSQNEQTKLTEKLRKTENNLKFLKNKNDALQNELASEKTKNENLQNQIRELEKENTKIKSELSNNRRQTTNNLRPMTTITTSSMPRTTNANFADNVLVLSTWQSSNKPMSVDFSGE